MGDGPSASGAGGIRGTHAEGERGKAIGISKEVIELSGNTTSYSHISHFYRLVNQLGS
jgi:hypothetical protein